LGASVRLLRHRWSFGRLLMVAAERRFSGRATSCAGGSSRQGSGAGDRAAAPESIEPVITFECSRTSRNAAVNPERATYDVSPALIVVSGVKEVDR